MKTITVARAAIAGLGLVAIAPLLLWGSRALAQGMCNGRTDPNVVVNAHANGQPGPVPKYIMNLSTDAQGSPRGALIVDRGPDRIQVEDWCRLWKHVPGQPYGECGEQEQEGATNLHAVGVTTLRDGENVLVRTDVRANDEGRFFRLRYRSLGGGEGDGCEDQGWTRIPAEGWYPLDQLRVREKNATR